MVTGSRECCAFKNNGLQLLKRSSGTCFCIIHTLTWDLLRCHQYNPLSVAGLPTSCMHFFSEVWNCYTFLAFIEGIRFILVRFLTWVSTYKSLFFKAQLLTNLLFCCQFPLTLDLLIQFDLSILFNSLLLQLTFFNQEFSHNAVHFANFSNTRDT